MEKVCTAVYAIFAGPQAMHVSRVQRRTVSADQHHPRLASGSVHPSRPVDLRQTECDHVTDDVVWEELLNREPDRSLRQVETGKPIAYLIDDTRAERKDAENDAFAAAKPNSPLSLYLSAAIP
jgi:hypothetical protein